MDTIPKTLGGSQVALASVASTIEAEHSGALRRGKALEGLVVRLVAGLFSLLRRGKASEAWATLLEIPRSARVGQLKSSEVLATLA